MPKVEQLNWNKLKPPLPERRTTHQDRDAIYWRYKKKTHPQQTSKKHGKVKLKDKQLISDDIANIDHLRFINHED